MKQQHRRPILRSRLDPLPFNLGEHGSFPLSNFENASGRFHIQPSNEVRGTGQPSNARLDGRQSQRRQLWEFSFSDCVRRHPPKAQTDVLDALTGKFGRDLRRCACSAEEREDFWILAVRSVLRGTQVPHAAHI
jgi:hypothetical protein